ncbi:MAG: corrinoid protein [Spirochaetales bacterium]|nr:corrinoid protein [Spirochaetales bacterium]
MDKLLSRLALCIEMGKQNKSTPYPKELAGQDGAEELVAEALEKGVSPRDILYRGCVVGMNAIGEKFKRKEVYVPQMLIAAKAMTGVMNRLKPFFISGEIKEKGIFLIGTVSGDLHDIGKNLVGMIVEGAGFKVVDLGVDVKPETFVRVIGENEGCAVGLSALLTTTMVNMEATVEEIKTRYPQTKVLIGGAPVTGDFAEKIGADLYSPDPQGAVEYLNSITEQAAL